MKKVKILQSSPTLSMIRESSWWLREGKNWAMLNASMLMVRFLTHPNQIMWVRVTPASIEDFLFKISKLTRMDEIIGNYVELKTFSNHFLKEFSYCVKKNNRAKWLGWVIRCLVRFGNNNCHWCLEMRWPVSQIYTGISDINEFTDVLFAFDDCLDITPC